MNASLLLLLAVVLAFTGGTGPWVIVVTVVFAAASGTTLPDLDTGLRLGHRSAILHGILPPSLALLDHRTWAVAAGLAFGVGLHLAADLFPGKMRGFATIKIPIWGSIGAGPSYFWITANAVINLIRAVIVLQMNVNQHIFFSVIAAVSVIGVTYLARAEGGLWVLTAFAVLGWLAFKTFEVTAQPLLGSFTAWLASSVDITPP